MWDEIHWFIFREGQEPNRGYRGALDDVLDGDEPNSVLDCVRYVLRCDEHMERMLVPATPAPALHPSLADARPVRSGTRGATASHADSTATGDAKRLPGASHARCTSAAA